MFVHQIGRNVQVYVDNMLVKSMHEEDHLDDLRETFDTLRSFNMKLRSWCLAIEFTRVSIRGSG